MKAPFHLKRQQNQNLIIKNFDTLLFLFAQNENLAITNFDMIISIISIFLIVLSKTPDDVATQFSIAQSEKAEK